MDRTMTDFLAKKNKKRGCQKPIRVSIQFKLQKNEKSK